MARGVRVNGNAVRSRRRALTMTQMDLANLAGIGERTVRKAEADQVIELHSAESIASALQLPVSALIAERMRANSLRTSKQIAISFEEAYGRAILTDEHHGLLRWLHPDASWFCMSSPATRFCGQFFGIDGVKQHCRMVKSWLADQQVRTRTPKYRVVHSEGEMLYLQGEVRMSPGRTQHLLRRFWIAKVIRFREKRVWCVDQFFGPLGP